MMQETALPAAAEAAAPAAQSAVQAPGPGSGFSLLPADGVFGKLFTADMLVTVARVALAVALGVLFVGVLVAVLRKLTRRRLSARTGALVVKVAQYLGFALIVLNAFEVAKVDYSALLGAAGIAGIALGFAAQTSVANFISGFFLVSEQTFAVGDVVSVDGTTGVVFSIDTLSIKLRTFDNQLIRIPNETLIKSNLTNITRFPVRRLNVKLTVSYETDIGLAKSLLMEAADSIPSILKSPEPFFMVQGFGKDGIDLFLGVWFAKDDWEPTNNGIHVAIKERFDSKGVSFAYPAVRLYKAREDPGDHR